MSIRNDAASITDRTGVLPATERSNVVKMNDYKKRKNPPTLLESIGNTPLVELTRIKADNGARILVKLEGNNPGGSVKERLFWRNARV